MIDAKTAPYGALLLRLVSGAFFLVHAGLKIFVFTPAGTAMFFTKLGLPGPLAYAVIALELLGGIALILGVAVRPVAVLLAADLLGAIVFVHIHNGFFFNDPNGGWEYPFFWMAALLAQALIGPGAHALGSMRVTAEHAA